MRFSTRIYVLVGLFVLLQLSFGAQKLKGLTRDANEKASAFHKHTEQLIEKVLYLVKDYHTRVRNVYKCVPEQIVQPAKTILKHSLECLDEIEKELDERRVTKSVYEKLFLRCLAQEKKEIENLTQDIDPTANLCPENRTEKTYQIDITTALKKALDINFRKGSKIIRKTIVLEAGEEKEEGKGEEEKEGESSRKEDKCETEKPEVSSGEEEYEMYNLEVPSVEYIEDSYNAEGVKEDSGSTEKPEMEGDGNGKLQWRNSEESDESGNVDELEESVVLNGEIFL